MKAKSVKRAFGLATAAVSTGGAMMLAPAVANAATAHPAHAQTASNISMASWGPGGYWGPGGNWGGGPAAFRGGGEDRDRGLLGLDLDLDVG